MAPVSAGAAPVKTSHVLTHKVVFPTHGAWAVAHSSHIGLRAANAGTRGLLSAHGGIDGIEVTTGAPKVYVVFYGSQWGTSSTNGSGDLTFSGDSVGLAPRLQEMLKGIGTNGELWSGVMTQYCDGVTTGTTSCASTANHVGYPTGGALSGVWYDPSVVAPSQATGHQLAAEAVTAASHFGNNTAAANRSAQYVIVSPTGTHPDGFNTSTGNFCAWHDYNGDTTLSGGAAASTVGDVAFTNLPYLTDLGASCGASYVNAGSAGALDGVSIVEGHEYAETVTDQNPGGGWWDSGSGQENGDKCAWVGTGGAGGAQNVAFATGSFPMQGSWSNDVAGCLISHAIVTNAPVPNDFSVSVSPASSSVVQGNGTTATISTATISGSPQSVALSVSGAPTGVTATLSPTSVTSGGTSTLNLSTSGTTAPGTYPLTIAGLATSGSHSTTFNLTVTSSIPNSYSLALSPSSGSTKPGGSVSASVVTSTTSGTPQVISLAASAPAGVSVQLATSSVTSGGSITLLISTNRKIAFGTYAITVTAKAGSGTQTVTYSLKVSATGLAGKVGNPRVLHRQHVHLVKHDSGTP